MHPGPLLKIRELRVDFDAAGDATRALDGFALDIARGEAVGLVGESGSGKTTVGLAIMRLLATPPARLSGEVMFEGVDLLQLSAAQLRALRGSKLAMVFQEPMTALNPVITVGEQIAEALRLHRRATRAAARQRTLELLRLVGLPAPEERLRCYPHELSGGMRQRVIIAMALACEPMLLVADEPTTALDATVQAQILALLEELQQQLGLALLLISHDLAVISRVCSRVVVLYRGLIVEQGVTSALLAAPRHPYTAALLSALPDPARRGERLAELPPAASAAPAGGCHFRDRCPQATARCAAEPPALREEGAGAVRCHFPRAVAPPAATTQAEGRAR